ncbi:hypothetical protein, partial [Caldimonas tepidiphila]|uniref:hypothetical protein n=1 Tax=Caldimonas tepidiphila TaxID=2315841 RepID=UPI00196ADECD
YTRRHSGNSLTTAAHQQRRPLFSLAFQFLVKRSVFSTTSQSASADLEALDHPTSESVLGTVVPSRIPLPGSEEVRL